MIAFELLTGRAPFSGQTAAALLLAQTINDAPAPSSLFSEVPERVDALVSSLLARDPQHRATSCAVVLGACAELLNEAGTPVPAPAQDFLTETAGAPLIKASIGSSFAAAPTVATPTISAASRQRRGWTLSLIMLLLAVLAAGGTAFGLPLAKRQMRLTRCRDALSKLAPLVDVGDDTSHSVKPHSTQGGMFFGDDVVMIDFERGVATVINAKTAAIESALVRNDPPVRALHKVNASSALVTRFVGDEGAASIVDLKTGAERLVAQGLAAPAIPSPDGRRFASISRGAPWSATGVFSIETGEQLDVLCGEKPVDKCRPVCWLDDDTLVVLTESSLVGVSLSTKRHTTFVEGGIRLAQHGAGAAATTFDGALLFARELPIEEGPGSELDLMSMEDVAAGRAPLRVEVMPGEAVVNFLVDHDRIALTAFKRDVGIRTAPIKPDGTLGVFTRLRSTSQNDRTPAFDDHGQLLTASMRAHRWEIVRHHPSGGEQIVESSTPWSTHPTLLGGSLLYWGLDPVTGAAELDVRDEGGHEHSLLHTVEPSENFSWGYPPPLHDRVACVQNACFRLHTESDDVSVLSALDVSGARESAVTEIVGGAELAVSKDGRTTAITKTESNELVFVDAPTRTQRSLRVSSCGKDCGLQSLAFLPGDDAVVVSAWDGPPLRLLRVPVDASPETELFRGDSWAGELAISPDGKTLAQAYWIERLRLLAPR